MAIVVNTDLGNVVKWTANFMDAGGNPAIPDSAAVYLNYPGPSGQLSAVIAMTFQSPSGPWTATWDSSVANRGIVYWSMRSVGPASAEDGQFRLSANPANIATPPANPPLDLLRGRLREAERAYHLLMTGRLSVEVVVEGQTVRFSRTNMNDLLSYISRLEAQLAAELAGCGGKRLIGAIGVLF